MDFEALFTVSSHCEGNSGEQTTCARMVEAKQDLKTRSSTFSFHSVADQIEASSVSKLKYIWLVHSTTAICVLEETTCIPFTIYLETHQSWMMSQLGLAGPIDLHYTQVKHLAGSTVPNLLWTKLLSDEGFCSKSVYLEHERSHRGTML